MSKKWNAKRQAVIEAFRGSGLCDETPVTRSDIEDAVRAYGYPFPQWVYEYSTGRNQFDLTTFAENNNDDLAEVADVIPLRKSPPVTSMFVPKRIEGYEEFGNFDDVLRIVETGIFYPTYITGLSGNGKTIMIEEICARLGREMIRVNITPETDESDLIGGFRIQNGTTVWEDGPAIVAMKRGAVLLLDEVDLGTPKLMCLQPILEGTGIFVKKIQQYIRPEKGFTVLATANTKGRGNSTGMFIGTQIMNEAFLERFAVTFEQDYPPISVEAKILSNILEKHKIEDEGFVRCLTQWAEKSRVAFEDGTLDAVISTRRLVHIVNSFVIFKDRQKAVKLGLNRFDEDLKKSFFDYYTKIDEEVSKQMAEEEERRNNPEAFKYEDEVIDDEPNLEIENEGDPLDALNAAIAKVNQMAV